MKCMKFNKLTDIFDSLDIKVMQFYVYMQVVYKKDSS